MLQSFHTPGIPEYVQGEVREVDELTAAALIERGLVEAVQAPAKENTVNKDKIK